MSQHCTTKNVKFPSDKAWSCLMVFNLLRVTPLRQRQSIKWFKRLLVCKIHLTSFAWYFKSLDCHICARYDVTGGHWSVFPYCEKSPSLIFAGGHKQRAKHGLMGFFLPNTDWILRSEVVCIIRSLEITCSISKGHKSNREEQNFRLVCQLAIHIYKFIHPRMCLVLWNCCSLCLKKFQLNLTNCMVSSEAPSFGVHGAELGLEVLHVPLKQVTHFMLYNAEAAASLQQQSQKNSRAAARRFRSEEAAYVMYVAEHCRASEKWMLRGATAIKGVWAIGKPRGYWSNTSTCWRR